VRERRQSFLRLDNVCRDAAKSDYSYDKFDFWRCVHHRAPREEARIVSMNVLEEQALVDDLRRRGDTHGKDGATLMQR
jgi:hypothetical protein